MAQVAVVGGGIIGCATACWLIADGHKVTLFERAMGENPTSTGSAGVIALSEVSPLARPGVLKQVPGWLLDPVGPLAVRFRDLPALTPWLLRLVASATPAKVEATTERLAWLMKSALPDHQELARRSGLSGHIRRTGSLYVAGSESAYRAAKVEWAERQRQGVEVEELTPEQTRARIPALSGPFTRSFFAPENWMVSSPLAILEALRARLRSSESVATQEVTSIHPEDREVAVMTDEGGDLPFDFVVVAGGVWSRDLVRRLGLKVSLETERGYNTTFPTPPFDLPMPIFFHDHGFVASPLADGFRVGGAVEMAAPEAPPNYARAAAMLKVMRRYAPAVPETGGRQWMGCRPSTPDSLPVIGAHPGDPRVIFAFGHGHLGITLSAATARHVASLIAGRPDPKLKPFGIGRFQ